MNARAFALAMTVTLAGCAGDFQQGDEVLAKVQRDPANHCRLIITQHFGKLPAMTATIDGCVQATGGQS